MRVYESDFPVPQELTAPGARFEMEERAFLGREWTLFRNAPNSFNAMLGDAVAALRAKAGERMIEQDGVVTSFGDFEVRSAALCEALREDLRVEPGSHVAIAMANRVEWMMAFVAIMAAGAVPVLVNSRGAGEEMRRAIVIADCVAVVCDQRCFDELTAGGELHLPVMLLGEASAAVADFAAASAPRAGLLLDFAARDPEDAALIMFSSGTTGHPKPIVHSQGGFAHALMLGFLVNESFDALYEHEFGEETYAELSGRPVYQLASPLFHVAGILPWLRCYIEGLPVLIVGKWNADMVFDVLEREPVARLGLVPTMIFDMLASPRAETGAMSQLRFLANGTAALSPQVAGAIRKALPRCLLLNTYGQTETMERCASFGGREYEDNLAAAGRVMPTMRLRILRDDGGDAELGEAGEIAVCSPTGMLGYYNDPEATAQAIRDGWLLTGDIGRFDAKGLLHIVDRKKNLVISGGENIYCAEVERVLAEHPAVSEALAFGEPDARLGERLVAAVVLKPDADAAEEEIKAHCKARLAIYKVPRAVGFTRDPLPRNATGKVAKGRFLETFARPWAAMD